MTSVVELRRDGDELVITRSGIDALRIPWPQHLADDEANFVAGQTGDWLLGGVENDPVVSAWRTVPDNDFAVRIRTFGVDAYDHLGRLLVEDVEPGGMLHVHAIGDAAALPLESIADPTTGFHHSLWSDGVTIIRSSAAITDVALWSLDGIDTPSTNFRVAFVNATPDSLLQGEHARAVQRCADAMGGEFRLFEVRSLDDLADAVAWRPTVLHVTAHGVSGRVLVGTDDASPADFADAITGAGVQVIVLNTCESSSHVDDGSVADALIERGVPYVVAARFEVGASAMAGFAHGFYARLAAGASIPECVKVGRLHMALDGCGMHHAAVSLHASTADASPHPAANSTAQLRLLGALGESWRTRSKPLPFLSLTPTKIDPQRPSTFLRPSARAVPLVGRDNQLEQLRTWRDSGDDLSVFALVGEGGIGKTRLGIEFAEASTLAGWIAGFVPAERGEAEINAIVDSDADMLVVLDYAETDPAFAAKLITEARLPSRRRHRRLRLLLIMRQRPAVGDWLSSIRTKADDDDSAALLDPNDKAICVSLDSARPNPERLWNATVQALCELLERDVPDSAVPAHVSNVSPLIVSASVYLAVIADSDAGSALGRVLDHERKW